MCEFTTSCLPSLLPEREKEREKEREREAHRHTDTHAHTPGKQRHFGKQAAVECGGELPAQVTWCTVEQLLSALCALLGSHAEVTHTHTHRQTERQTDRHTHTHLLGSHAEFAPSDELCFETARDVFLVEHVT